MSNLKREDGYALVLTVVIVAVLLIFVGVMVRLIDNELNFYNQNKSSSRAFYAAESGIAYGSEIFWDSSKRNELTDQDGNTYYKFNDTSGTDIVSSNLENAELESLTWYFIKYNGLPAIRMHATGISNGVLRSVTSVYSTYNNIFDNAISAAGKITIKNNHIVTSGNITTTEAIDGEFKDEEGNLINVNVDPDFSIPNFDYAYLRSLAEEVITPSSGEISFSEIVDYDTTDSLNNESDIGKKFIYIDGDLNVKSNKSINGSGVLVIDGKLILGSNIRVNQDEGYENDFYTIIVRGDSIDDGIVLEGDNKIEMRGLIYSTGDTDLGNSFDLTGAIVSGGSLDFMNSPNSVENIDYNPGFIDKLMSWGISFPDDETTSNKSIYKLLTWYEG